MLRKIVPLGLPVGVETARMPESKGSTRRRRAQVTIEDTLATVPLFSQLSRKDLKHLAVAVIMRDYKKGETIVQEGENAVAFYVIKAGQVDIIQGRGGKKEKPLATLGPGDFFGEMALLDFYPRSASAVATEPTQCLVLSRWDFIAELRTNPHIAVQMLPVLSRRLREAQQGVLAQE
jgi:CRP/FNR family cyclic AMP-dependent transcriptional regulator